MITVEQVRKLVNEKLEATEGFLVDLSISPGNKIRVEVDKPKGISIGECIQVSRHIEHSLDRDTEDFALEVASPGADSPFKVMEQYYKSVGRKVQVAGNTGECVKGVLMQVNADGIIVESEKGKGKMATKELNEIPFVDIKETKLTLSFK